MTMTLYVYLPVHDVPGLRFRVRVPGLRFRVRVPGLRFRVRVPDRLNPLIRRRVFHWKKKLSPNSVKSAKMVFVIFSMLKVSCTCIPVQRKITLRW